jgi:hypothetical protein
MKFFALGAFALGMFVFYGVARAMLVEGGESEEPADAVGSRVVWADAVSRVTSPEQAPGGPLRTQTAVSSQPRTE